MATHAWKAVQNDDECAGSDETTGKDHGKDTAEVIPCLTRGSWQAIEVLTDDVTPKPPSISDSVQEPPSPKHGSPCFPRNKVVFAAVVILAISIVATIITLRKTYASTTPAPYVLQLGFQQFRIASYDTVLMAYNGRIVGPTFVVHAGDALLLHLENRLPKNKKFAPTMPTVSSQWPCWRSAPNHSAPVPAPSDDTAAVYGNHLPSELARSPLDYVNSPHAFRTTNIHTHGLQVRTQLTNAGCINIVPPSCRCHRRKTTPS